jgi:hypothetical protein
VASDGQTWEFLQNFARFEDGRLAIETENASLQPELRIPPKWSDNPSELVLPFELYLNELFLLGKEKLLAIVKTRGLQLLILPNNPDHGTVPTFRSPPSLACYTDIYSPLIPSMMFLGTTMTKVSKKGRRDIILRMENNCVSWDPLWLKLWSPPSKGFGIIFITNIETGLGLELEDIPPQNEEEASRSFSITYHQNEHHSHVYRRGRHKTKHMIAPSKAIRDIWLRIIRTAWEVLKKKSHDACKEREANSFMDLCISESIGLISKDVKIEETGEGLFLASNAADANSSRPTGRSRRLSI